VPTVTTKKAAAFAHYEAELGHRLLPRCRKCQSPHPLAVRSARDKTRCVNPSCDEPAGQPGPQMIEGAIPYMPPFLMFLASAIGKLAVALARLSRKVDQ
jgi:hypothetical protein